MRGKGSVMRVHSFNQRITPAYAGKSKGNTFTRAPYGDHPRLCGEKALLLLFSIMMKGSPPPMRGKVLIILRESILLRITPAYAGKSFRKTAVRHAIKDHPRLCGEK